MTSNGRCLVTGVGGFIGSHLAERLLDAGHSVIGIDAFTDYYPPQLKRANLQRMSNWPTFHLVAEDLLQCDLTNLLSGVDYVFHHAAQPGVRKSWGTTFETYVRHNILATQRLLETVAAMPVKRFVYASSSSVYGDAESFPTSEDSVPRPVSPYGVTKLAGEHLCQLYWRSHGIPTVALRYFTVYGPRQRPDMAFSAFIHALASDNPIVVCGDGRQTRDFTYIDDIVDANLLAVDKEDAVGEIFNIGGGARVSLLESIHTLEGLMERTAQMHFQESQIGDARDTSADIGRARRVLGYHPKVHLQDGLEQQVRWYRDREVDS